ncbi:hypothetical protein XENOCAPTIV_018763, partial [Xenoophorus captivus]
YVPPDLCICTFVLEQSLSVRALQEMLAKSGQNSEGTRGPDRWVCSPIMPLPLHPLCMHCTSDK